MNKTIAILTITSALIFSGCGGSNNQNTSTNTDIQQNAISHIYTYADDQNITPPTVEDYINAGITGVTEENLEEVNSVIAEHTKDEVDTQEEIQAIVNQINTNIPPIANAGRDFIIQLGDSITIHGEANDSDGKIVSYKWMEGNITLSSFDTFTYHPSSIGEHILEFIVTDDKGATASDTCSVIVNSTSTKTIPTVHITEKYQVIRLGKSKETEIHLSIDTDKSKSIYLLLSNYSQSSSASTSISHSSKLISSIDQKNNSSSQLPYIKFTPEEIQEFNRNIIKPSNVVSHENKILLVKNNSEEGDSKTFYLDVDESGDKTEATLQKQISDISTEFGNKTLNIWVSNDSFDSGSGCNKSKCVTQEMVDALADTFLRSGDNNDIYDWDTNIFGEEWGNNAKNISSYFISATDTIDILLTDIQNDDSTNGGVLGYFYSKDNYESSAVSGSNEKIMFYIDSVLFANGDGNWDIDDFWPKEMVSTLAHEFQHMIHFYQKTVLRANKGTDTWLNEMLSETMEDIIATKIKHSGPRGVSYTDGSAGDPGNREGRYPDFNKYNTLSLTSWDGTLADYSKVNAFGAYLVRNYGVGILHDIVQSKYVHEDAVEYAIQKTPEGENKTFDDLLREWGVAVILSSIESPNNLPTYNTGDFIESSYNNITYDLGSINFFNYSPQPKFYTTAGKVKPQGNYYYKVGENLKGIIDLNITLNGTTEATLIAK